MTALNGPVEAFATADIEALRAWYTSAASLSKRAIKDADPQNHQQLLELLELA